MGAGTGMISFASDSVLLTSTHRILLKDEHVCVKFVSVCVCVLVSEKEAEGNREGSEVLCNY